MSGKKSDPGSAPDARGTESSSPTCASTGPTPAAETEPAQPKDVLFVRGASEDGRGLSVLRFSDDRVTTGELREARDGQPIMGELVALTQRGEHERLYDVSVLARGPGAPGSDASGPHRPALPGGGQAKGPAKVASDAYREGWENVFGTSSKPNLPN